MALRSTANPVGIVIRSAQPREFDAVGRVTVEGFLAVDAHGHIRRAPSQAQLAEYRDAAGRAAGGDLLVAVDVVTGAIVGTASLLWSDSELARVAGDREAELRFVTVATAYRSWGIAQALTAEAVHRAEGWGVDAVVLTSRVTGAVAQRVYERIKFERVAERESEPSAGGEPLRVYVRAIGERPEPGGLEIRLMRPDEADAVGELLIGAYESDYEIDPEYREDILDVASRAEVLEVWVAVDSASGELLGSLTTPRAGETIEDNALDHEMDLRLLGVAPSARGRGVAKALMAHAARLAAARGLSSIMLMTGPTMTAAHRLYEGLGYVRQPERETVVVGDNIRLLMYTADV